MMHAPNSGIPAHQPVTAVFRTELIPTYQPGKPNPLPMFFEKKPYQGATGKLYPLPLTDRLSDEKTDKPYQVAVLENEYIKIRVLPEIGGKIQQGYDKIGQYDFIYHNTVIKPAMIGLAGPWVSGGIEFNWPQHHRPTTFMPVEARIEACANGEKTVWVGEVEPFNRTKGMAGVTVCPGRSYIKLKVRIFNRTPFAQPFMWWSNLAVPVNKNYQVVFPPDVEYVNDHDRRAVIGWPVASGTYQTARPYNYGQGTDLSLFPNVVVPTSFMVSQGQSDMDFVSGYDLGRDQGIVTVADHAIAPGKKLFHWGDHDFGANWCANLTDDDGPYVELMTGAYTDNQPDFSWIRPYETKSFEQYWYPVRQIGAVKNATPDAAVNLEPRDSGLFVGFNVTGDFPGCAIRIYSGEALIYEDQADLVPEEPYTRLLDLSSDRYRADHLSVTLAACDGHLLVGYRNVTRGSRQPVEPRRPAERPQQITTVEELYINGLHLEQYKHHTYVAEHYYLEGLRRDAGDSRCNTAMGRLCLKQGRFDEAAAHYKKAITRLTARNNHPEDVEAFYGLGLALEYQNQTRQAEAAFHRCIWQYSHRSAGYLALAQIDAHQGEYRSALAKLENALATDQDNLKAICLQAALTRNLGETDRTMALAGRVLAADPLDFWSRVEICFARIQARDADAAAGMAAEIHELFYAKPENYIDIAIDYMAAGFYYDALELLDMADQNYPLVLYYMGRCHALTGDPGRAAGCFRQADKADPLYCFPARLEDIAVLKCAGELDPAGAMAHYYLGCLYYDRSRADDAIAEWEAALRLDTSYAPTHRNLALALFDKRGDRLAAREHLAEALRLDPDNARLLYELQQLCKNMNDRPEARLSLYARHADLVDRRDDCYMDRIILLTMQGEYDQAISLAESHAFHIYEGGEGLLTRHHAWLHTLKGNRLYDTGDFAAAEAEYQSAFVIPDNYGEGKSYFAQENHVWYSLALLYERTGRLEKMHKALAEASVDKATISEISLFRALAVRKLGRVSEAAAILQEMIEAGEKLLAEPDLYPYFGVGSPTPVPFEYNIIKINTVNGSLLKGFALLGYGRLNEARQAVAAVRALAPWNFQLHLFDKTAERLQTGCQDLI